HRLPRDQRRHAKPSTNRTPFPLMNKYCERLTILSIVTATLVAGCGGGGGDTPAPTPAPAQAPAPAPAPAPDPAQATTWKSVKFGGGGYVSGVVFHPTTANLLYARTDIGGAYRWNQAAASWVPITDGLGFSEGESRYHGIESIA